MIVYLVQNRHNGKCYVGISSLTLEERWKTHVKNALSGRTSRLYSAIRKYGVEAFTLSLLHTASTLEELKAMETVFIILHQSHLPENGYNMTMGGETSSPEVGEKIRAAMLRRMAEGTAFIPSNKGNRGYKRAGRGVYRPPRDPEAARAALRAAWVLRKAASV